MSLKEPKRNVALPHGVQELLSRMFARDTGFSGPEILSFFSRYSLAIDSYPWSGGAPSRWQILEDCLATFPLQQQKRIIEDLLKYDGPMKYGRPADDDVQRIRQWVGEGPTPVAAAVAETQRLNWKSVTESATKAAARVSEDPAGAITAARTLLESVCLHVLSERGVAYQNDGDIQRLYRTASRTLDLAPDQKTEEQFRQLLGGCATVVNGLAGIRNALGDAHGHGPTEAVPSPRHARLAVSAAGAVAMFMIETHLEHSE